MQKVPIRNMRLVLVKMSVVEARSQEFLFFFLWLSNKTFRGLGHNFLCKGPGLLLILLLAGVNSRYYIHLLASGEEKRKPPRDM